MDILFDDMIRQRGASRSYNAASIVGYSPEDFEEDEYGSVPDVKDRSPRIPKINISDVQWIGEELNLFDSIKYNKKRVHSELCSVFENFDDPLFQSKARRSIIIFAHNN